MEGEHRGKDGGQGEKMGTEGERKGVNMLTPGALISDNATFLEFPAWKSKTIIIIAIRIKHLLCARHHARS